MRAVLCDKCGRRCDRDTWIVSVKHPKMSTKDGGLIDVDMCAVCVFALSGFLPSSVRTVLPSKDRVAMVERTDPTKPPTV